MTRIQFKANVQELLETSYATITARVDRAIDSGALNYTDEPPGNYGLAKAVLTALLLDEAESWRPLAPPLCRQVNNIRACMPS